jgi:arylsulfatase A-like enzyme
VDVTDVMPTLLDAVGVPIPETVEGRSVLPLLHGEADWRRCIHGECANVTSLDSGMQFLTDGQWRYIWFPALGTEQFFDLVHDPREMTDLAPDPAYAAELRDWRARLIRELTGRPEGFTDGRSLLQLDGPTANIIRPLAN